MGGGGHRGRAGFPPRLRSNRRGNHRSGVAALTPHEGRGHARHELRRGAGGDLPLRQGDERRDRPRGDEAEAPGVSFFALAGGGVLRPRGIFGGVCARVCVRGGEGADVGARAGRGGELN